MRIQLFIASLLFLLASVDAFGQSPKNKCVLDPDSTSVQHCDTYPVEGLENKTISQILYGPDGNLFMSGSPPSEGEGWDVMVSKLSPDAELVWEARAAENGTAGSSALALSKNGSVAICGMQTTGGITHPKHAFVAVFDAHGNLVWENKYFEGAISECDSVAFTVNEDIAIVGNKKSGFWGTRPFIARISSDGELLWTKDVPNIEARLQVILSTDDDQIIVGGSDWSNRYEKMSAVLLTYSGFGELIKTNRFKFEDGERITHLATTHTQKLALGGSPSLGSKAIIGVASLNGKARLNREQSVTEKQIIMDISVLKDGRVVILNRDYSDEKFNLLGIEENGELKWRVIFDGCKSTFLSNAALSDDGDVFVLCGDEMILASIKR